MHLPSIFAFLLLVQGLFSEPETNPTVFLTTTGVRYHVASCRYLLESKLPILLSEAVKNGYSPCEVCKPPIYQLYADSDLALQETGLFSVNLTEFQYCQQVDLSKLLPGEVVGHVDGDTVIIRIPEPPPNLLGIETVRLIGVDAPETVHPQRKVEQYGAEASDFTKERLLGQPIRLAFDWNLRDHYKRLLAYIYLLDGSCFNAELIREGYAHAYTRFPFQFLDEFREFERQAREDHKGLWALSLILDPDS